MNDECTLFHRPGLNPDCECGRRAVLAAADTIPRPRRRFELKITIGADTLEHVLESMREIATHVEERRASCSRVLGGYEGGYSIEISEAPEMSHTQYFEALEEWGERRSEAMDTEARRQRAEWEIVSLSTQRGFICAHCAAPLRGEAVRIDPDDQVQFRCAACGLSSMLIAPPGSYSAGGSKTQGSRARSSETPGNPGNGNP